jgi:hypothetical protein
MKLGEGELNIFMALNFVSNFTLNKASDEKLKPAITYMPERTLVLTYIIVLKSMVVLRKTYIYLSYFH